MGNMRKVRKIDESTIMMNDVWKKKVKRARLVSCLACHME